MYVESHILHINWDKLIDIDWLYTVFKNRLVLSMIAMRSVQQRCIEKVL